MDENTKVAVGEQVIEYVPAELLVTPLLVPFILTETPSILLLSFNELINPVTVIFWANTDAINAKQKTKIRNKFFIRVVFEVGKQLEVIVIFIL